MIVPPPPLVVPHPLSFPGGGAGGPSLGQPKFFVVAHCVVVWVTVLWATCIPCTHGRTFCSLLRKWNLVAQPCFPPGQVPPLERQISKTRRYTNVVCCPDMFNAIVSPRTRGPWHEQGSSFAGGRVQRVHRRGSQVLSEFCKVGYSATLARAHVHRFICSENRGLPSLGDLCREVI